MATTPPVTTQPPNPPPSDFQSAPNLVAFDPKQVVPSQTIYLQRNDFVCFNTIANTFIINIRINYRWLTPQGEIKEGEFDFTITGGSGFTTLPIYEGWLLSFAARVTSAINLGTWAFLQAFIARSNVPAVTSPLYGMFWQGFITFSTQNGWPGTPAKEITDGLGKLRSIVGTTPAAGAEILETVTGQRRWSLLAFSAQLTASATVINRNVTVILDDGGNSFTRTPSFINQTAGQVIIYALGTNPNTVASLAGSTILATNLPIQLRGGCRIRTATTGLQVGDQWSPPTYLVQEWGDWDV